MYMFRCYQSTNKSSIPQKIIYLSICPPISTCTYTMHMYTHHIHVYILICMHLCACLMAPVYDHAPTFV